MSEIFRTSKGESIKLKSLVASSGEAQIWTTTDPKMLAKIYNSAPDIEKIFKLEVMIDNPPDDPNTKKGHFSWTWPAALLFKEKTAVGFVMPEIEGGREIIEIYNPRIRRRENLDVNWQFLHVVALNVASIVAAIHAKGYVIGDMKPQNILVNNRALPSIIDTDSFQIKDPNSYKIYNCPVGSEDTTPPELIGANFRETVQSEIHDRFRLGIIIFLLLFGEHPFKQVGGGEPLAVKELIQKCMWLNSSSHLQSSNRIIPLDIVNPELQHYFSCCFSTGHSSPEMRPSAIDWFNALRTAYKDLLPCRNVTPIAQKSHPHYYEKSYGTCYWCERACKIGFDIFGHSVATTTNIFDAQNITLLTQSSEKKVSIQGKVYEVIYAKRSLILKFGEYNPKSTIGNFEIVLKPKCLKQLSDKDISNIKRLVGRLVLAQGTIHVRQLQNKKTPQIVVETLPIPLKIFE